MMKTQWTDRAIESREELQQYLLELDAVVAEHASADTGAPEARRIAARAVEMERRLLAAFG